MRVSARYVVFAEEYVERDIAGSFVRVNGFTFAHDYRGLLREFGYVISDWKILGKLCVFKVDKDQNESL